MKRPTRRRPRPRQGPNPAAAFQTRETACLIDQVRALLGGQPISVCDYFWYFSFARSVRGLMRRSLGPAALANEVRAVLNIWQARGLKDQALRRILNDCFALGHLFPSETRRGDHGEAELVRPK